ncbi:hypothetical protein, partial [Teichococcus vastitatis]
FGGITPLQAKEIVLHGLTLQDGQGTDAGEADGTQGYKDVLPVASGELHEVGAQYFLDQAFRFPYADDGRQSQDNAGHGQEEQNGNRCGASNHPNDLQVFTTDFTALNNSGVDGQALLFLDARSQTLTMHIKAEGLEPGQVHVQHIHGFDNDKDAKTPTLAQDDDRDGFVELAEGLDT